MNLEEIKKYFDKNGFVVIKNLIPNEVVSTYSDYHEKNLKLWKRSIEQRIISDWEYRDDIHTEDEVVNSFLHTPQIIKVISHLLDFEHPDSLPNLHLSLVPWVSIGQTWHYDEVSPELLGLKELNRPKQIGAWIALDTITLESGPFGFIPRSNHIDYYSDLIYIELKKHYEDKLVNEYQINFSLDNKPFFKNTNKAVTKEFIMQPYSELIAEYTSKCINENILKDEIFTANSGDVLFWSGRTLHCAHRSINGQLRKSIIGHYV